MNKNEIYKKVADELGLKEEEVRVAYNLYWKFIKMTIEDLPLDDDLTEEQFSKLRTNFNINSIGKLYCSYQKYSNKKKCRKFRKKDRYED